MSHLLPSANYTPQYSDELLAVVSSVYKQEISPNLPTLQLSKMIDLLDSAQDSIEQYTEALKKGDFSTCLSYYVYGVFYMYWVIPDSIQFALKNKNYEVFMLLKGLYEKESNMGNVRRGVVEYIGYLNELKDKKRHITPMKRAQTVPSSVLHHDLTKLLESEMKELDVSDEEVVSSSSSSEHEGEEIWTPPTLLAKDQLQLAIDNSSSTDLHEKSADEDAPSYAPPPPPPHAAPPIPPIPEKFIPPLNHHNTYSPISRTTAHRYSDATQPEPYLGDLEEDSTDTSFLTNNRKDSYRAVYDNSESDSIPTISPAFLFKALSSASESFLIFDIRPKHAHDINTIPYANLIQVDPSVILESQSYQELSDALKSLLSQQAYLLFRNARHFDVVMSLSDNKTYFANKMDYLIKFHELLSEANIRAKTLSGGFDQWLRYINKTLPHSQSKELHFRVKSPMSAIPEMPSIPPPSLPSQPAPSFGTAVFKSSSFDYNKMFPKRENTVSPNTQIDGITANGTVVTSSTSSQISQPKSNQKKPPEDLVPIHKGENMMFQKRAQPAVATAYPPPTNNSEMHLNTYVHPQPSQQPYPVNHYYQPIAQAQQVSYFDPLPQFQPYTQPQQHYNRAAQLRPQHPVPQALVPTIQTASHPFVRMSITGLRNMKNTCYINSMLQCLFESQPLRSVFLSGRYRDYWNEKFLHTQPGGTRLAFSLAKLFEKMYLNGNCSVIPSSFLRTCSTLRPDLEIPSEQQDTQEFLMFMLDRMHDELSNTERVVDDFPELLAYDGQMGEEYEKWFENVLLKQGFSPISKCFQGQLQDSLTCQNCGFTSSNYSSFYMLSLGIPHPKKTMKKARVVTLEDCIDMFTRDELLAGDNAWDCPKCSPKPAPSTTYGPGVEKSEIPEKRRHRIFNSSLFRVRSASPSPKPKDKSKRDAMAIGSSESLPPKKQKKNSTIKSLKFVALPPTLIIHLSRFLFYDTSQKDTTVIQYPTHLTIEHGGKSIFYRLFGVVNHTGTLKSGHYTSVVHKGAANGTMDGTSPAEGGWYYFDDEVVKGTSHYGRMSSENAYVLFYERVN